MKAKKLKCRKLFRASESVEPESILKATEKAVEEVAHIESEKQVQQPAGRESCRKC